jgi:type II secretory pathway pseudopilin PulG
MKLRTHRQQSTGFTLVEISVVALTLSILMLLLAPAGVSAIRKAKRVGSISNLKLYLQADVLYLQDHEEFPLPDTVVPSSISRNRLAIVAQYSGLEIPDGPIKSWPRRKLQPAWINDPVARDSGFAEGMTVGGGLYTGYMYVGRIEESAMIQSGMATLTEPLRSANRKNTRRGVLWATVLTEFKTGDPRRYECFHYKRTFGYPDFRFKEEDLEGQARGWSDGSIEWVSANEMNFGSNSTDLQIRHLLGNIYY